MKRLKHFSIPIQGLKGGTHNFEFKLDEEVFSAFDFGDIDKGEFLAKVRVERMTGHFDLFYSIEGKMLTSCDRCTADISLDLSAEEHFVIKVGEERKMVDNVIFILVGDFEFNVAKYLYESICLQVPIVKTIDCEDMKEEEQPCDKTTLDYLNTEEKDDDKGSLWDSLKEIKFEN